LYGGGVAASTKYAAFSELSVTDVRVEYRAANNEVFLCEELDDYASLDVIFSDVPAPDTCSATCGTWSQNRFATEVPTGFAGLNCSDSNAGWYTTAPAADNARIGARYSSYEMSGFLGTMGSRSYSSSYESTWGTDSEGAETEDSVLLYVR
jgi:hypothetical protein